MLHPPNFTFFLKKKKDKVKQNSSKKKKNQPNPNQMRTHKPHRVGFMLVNQSWAWGLPCVWMTDPATPFFLSHATLNRAELIFMFSVTLLGLKYTSYSLLCWHCAGPYLHLRADAKVGFKLFIHGTTSWPPFYVYFLSILTGYFYLPTKMTI